jgi:hypothetical protein
VLPQLAQLDATVSRPRLNTYLVAAGRDEARALRLYMWNAAAGEAFHLPLQAVEIALRNRIDSAFRRSFGQEWWQEPGFLTLLKPRSQQDIQTAIGRLKRRGLPLDTNQIVATLSFGFWTSMLDRRFYPKIWSRHLRDVFPYLPNALDRAKVEIRLRAIADFRNRVAHHEPILKEDLSKRHSETLETLDWLCTFKRAWVEPECRAMSVLRGKP